MQENMKTVLNMISKHGGMVLADLLREAAGTWLRPAFLKRSSVFVKKPVCHGLDTSCLKVDV